MSSGEAVQASFEQQPPEKLVAHLPCGRLQAQMLFSRVRGDLATVRVQFQLVAPGEFHDETFVRIRLGSTQFVIEMNQRKDDAEFAAQIEKEAQQGDGIRPARHRYANSVPGLKELMLANVGENGLREHRHDNMVQLVCGKRPSLSRNPL